MNIYLDIDGVILTKNQQPAPYLKEFLSFLSKHYPTYWLTTHCKGDANHTINYLSQFLDTETIQILKKVQATNWQTAKTEAIDFNKSFLWFDDQIFEFEKEKLVKHNCLKSWIKVNLIKNPNQLKDILNIFLNKKED